jgi:quercetin dioxygenase-like cupin family protein
MGMSAFAHPTMSATTAAPSSSFEAFSTWAQAQGFDEVLTREWAPGQVLDTHSHPFQIHARVTRGEVWLTDPGGTHHVPAGGQFELQRDVPHAERYGPEGATFWVARKHSPSV